MRLGPALALVFVASAALGAPRTLRDRALAAYLAGRLDEACPIYAKAAARRPASGALWAEVANCEQQRHHSEDAIAAWLKVVRLGDETLRLRAYFALEALGISETRTLPAPRFEHVVGWSTCETRRPATGLACEREWRLCVDVDQRPLGSTIARVEPCEGLCGELSPELDDPERRPGPGTLGLLRRDEAPDRAEPYFTAETCHLVIVDPCGSHAGLACDLLGPDGQPTTHDLSEVVLQPASRTCAHTPCRARWSGALEGESSCAIAADDSRLHRTGSLRVRVEDPLEDGLALDVVVSSIWQPLTATAADRLQHSAGALHVGGRALFTPDRDANWLALQVHSVCVEDDRDGERSVVLHGRATGHLTSTDGAPEEFEVVF